MFENEQICLRERILFEFYDFGCRRRLKLLKYREFATKICIFFSLGRINFLLRRKEKLSLTFCICQKYEYHALKYCKNIFRKFKKIDFYEGKLCHTRPRPRQIPGTMHPAPAPAPAWRTRPRPRPRHGAPVPGKYPAPAKILHPSVCGRPSRDGRPKIFTVRPKTLPSGTASQIIEKSSFLISGRLSKKFLGGIFYCRKRICWPKINVKIFQS